MDTIKERVSYLRGLSDGLGIGQDTKEGKLLTAIVEILGEMAEEIELLNEGQEELDEYVNAIDEDLSAVEDDFYVEDEDDEEDGYVEVECPNCHETVYLDEDMFNEEDEEILCPNCNEPLPIEFECDCCGHDHEHNE
jgi:hypothetical protein